MMTLQDWLGLIGVVLAAGIPLGAWMNALYRKVAEIAVNMKHVETFINEARPELKEIGKRVERHSEMLSDHGRRLECLEE